jgi:peptide/nickel transport system ATP-binding protein
MALLDVDNLHTRFGQGGTALDAVRGISLHIDAGETLCLVGESGSGKSVTGLSIMGLLPDSASHPQGKVLFTSSRDAELRDVSMLDATPGQLETIRGARISMIFQEPMTALNPVLTIGSQLLEPLAMHLGLEGAAAKAKAIELLEQVEMPDPERRLADYPHRLSGGQRQRVMIAMALACEPDLLIADEPTTALDVTIQAQILELLHRLQKEHGTALLFITHDLSVVAQIADRVAVMQLGKIVEQGTRDDVLFAPQHEYTKELLAALPGNLERLDLPKVEAPTPLIRLQNLKVYFPIKKGILQRHVDDVRAVDDVTLDINEGKAMALVGESGSGKTTLGRAILGLIKPTAGAVMFEGRDLAPLTRSEFKPYRKDLQIVFQDPHSSLNPRLKISAILVEPMAANGIGADHAERLAMAAETLERVGLEAAMLRRFPHEFSGGQRQRIGIARALALNPKFIVCDEVTSALDVSVQARVLRLLDELRREFDITYLFVTHNIDVVRYFCDEVAVMYQGKLVEQGDAQQVCSSPNHAYTQRLIDAVPKFVA